VPFICESQYEFFLLGSSVGYEVLVTGSNPLLLAYQEERPPRA
jgi:hypothetical protein